MLRASHRNGSVWECSETGGGCLGNLSGNHGGSIDQKERLKREVVLGALRADSTLLEVTQYMYY